MWVVCTFFNAVPSFILSHCSGTSGITSTLSESEWDITHCCGWNEGGWQPTSCPTAQTQACFNYSYTRASGKIEGEQRNSKAGERSQDLSECATSSLNCWCSKGFKENAAEELLLSGYIIIGCIMIVFKKNNNSHISHVIIIVIKS